MRCLKKIPLIFKPAEALIVVKTVAPTPFIKAMISLPLVPFVAQAILRPTGILPFSRSKEDIIPYYKQWIKKKAFSPNKLRKNFKADQVQGVYLPVFTFDSLAHTNYRGRLGKKRTRTVHRNGKTYTETYTEWFYVSGSLSRKEYSKGYR